MSALKQHGLSSQHLPWVKFCGISSVDDALLAMKLGVAYLGLIFVPGTSRFVETQTAASIINATRQHAAGSSPEFVGVFQGSPEQPEGLQRMLEIQDFLKLDVVQCHGQEPPEWLLALPTPVFKVLSVSSDMTLAQLREAAAPYLKLPEEKMPCFLLDLPKRENAPESLNERLLKMAGNHQRLQEALGNRPYALAGKLAAEQLAPLLASWRPLGLDVASGIEKQLGVKDPDKMKAFLAALSV
ncbi:MAG: phosphoribosylanthranilate isomerase [Vampirovibrionales bacterium]|nr:phosphoribosylanthranilate isomerase [Vampirovibrionales bacterium]